MNNLYFPFCFPCRYSFNSKINHKSLRFLFHTYYLDRKKIKRTDVFVRNNIFTNPAYHVVINKIYVTGSFQKKKIVFGTAGQWSIPLTGCFDIAGLNDSNESLGTEVYVSRL